MWFSDQAQEAANLYTSLFKDARITNVRRYGEAAAEVSGREKGTMMTVSFQVDGQEFVALNGGPHFTFTPAVSFSVSCQTNRRLMKSSSGSPRVECRNNAAG